MRWLSPHLREPSRGRHRFREREWWLYAYMPRPWNRHCSPDCRVGTTYEWADEDGNERVSVRDHREDCPRSPVYLGTIAKGWWSLWTLRNSLWRWSSEVVVAIGGEDNMAQISVQLPILGRVAAGVHVPHSWTKSWVYERRELGVELRGLWPTILLGYDERASEMRGYYATKREQIENGTAVVTNAASAYLPSRFAIMPGWRISLPRVRWLRLQNRVFGPAERRTEILKTYMPVTVTLPEGDYIGLVTFERETVKRKHGRVRRDEVCGRFESQEWMPWPGKGENSYDCGDDGTKEHTVRIGPGRMQEHEIGSEDVAAVIAATIGYVLKYRARYGRYDWKPDGVGVMRD